MKLSRTVAYAVQATLQLAKNSSAAPIPCSRIAAAGNMPERFLLQILRNLVTHGIMRSTRGVEGGYTLTRPADEISLLEVIEAIEGPIQAHSQTEHGFDGDEQDKLRQALEAITETARQQLHEIKLSHLISAS